MNTLMKMACNSEDFATRRFSTLTTVFGHLDGVGSHKNTRYDYISGCRPGLGPGRPSVQLALILGSPGVKILAAFSGNEHSSSYFNED